MMITLLRWDNIAPYLALTRKWAAPAGSAGGPGHRSVRTLPVTAVPVPTVPVHCARWTRGSGALPCALPLAA